ncbi:MAG: serine hydrolase [Bacteroidales bacterium]|nr:serine hydrolase [Bacteroidales bacterium]MBK7173858.1 serine hydrolase [Bacteroidales bacterium]
MNKKLFRVISIVLLSLALIWLLLPVYLRKAIVYQHPGIDDYSLFANRQVAKGIPLPWKKHPEYNKLVINDSSIAYFRQYGTTAFVVIQNDSLLHEEYWDGYADSSLSNSFSMAKSIVSLLIGCLLDEGKIKSLDQPITDYIQEFKGEAYQNIRIKDLLSMSSGLDWDEAYSSAFSKTTQAYYGQNLSELVTSLQIAEAPGKIFRYKSCDTQLLSIIIEKASGKSLATYASEKLWQPLGAQYDAYWSLDTEDGHEKAYCCFNSNATDFARIGQLVLDTGQFNQKQVISREYMMEATSPATWLVNESGEKCDWYGYQFWRLTYKGMNIIYARGILGQYIFVIPELKTVVVRLGHKRSEIKRGNVPEDVYIYLDAAINLLNSGPIY